jgi:hypothetical protein
MMKFSRLGYAVASKLASALEAREGRGAGAFAKRACPIAAAFAAALLAPVAGADLTITLTNRTLVGMGSFSVPRIRAI